MSNRVFQGIVHQMVEVIDRTFGVIDETGTVISCSELGKIGEIQSHAVSDVFASLFLFYDDVVFDNSQMLLIEGESNLNDAYRFYRFFKNEIV